MSTRELVELAQLDAMGLLDEQEAREFEVAFAAAPAEIQEQIRTEQARMCVLEPVLPDVQAPEHLRGKVLSKVHEAIIESIVEKAPAPVSEVQAPIPAFAPAARHEAGREIPGIDDRRRVRSSRLWRTAALAFAAAAVVLGVTTLRLQSQFERVSSQKVAAESLGDANKFLGGKLSSFFFSDVKKTMLNPVRQSDSEWQKVQAVVAHNVEWSEALLVCTNLPSAKAGEKYELVAVDGKDQVLSVIASDLKPAADGGIVSFSIPKDISADAQKLALRIVRNGAEATATIVLESKSLLG